MLLACCLCINSCCGLCLMNQDPVFFIWCWQTLPGGSSDAVDCHIGRDLVISNGRMVGVRGSGVDLLLVERAQQWFQIIWFNLFWGGIKLVLRIVHFAVASRRLRSHIKLENCSFGRLRRMHNADLYPFDCHRCGLKKPWHCLSVWSWLILKVHWEENKVGIQDDYPWSFWFYLSG